MKPLIGLTIIMILLSIASMVLTTINKKEEVVIPVFSCYKQEGTKCSVTSNKENPCSYAFLVCKTPEGKTIYRSENIK